MDVMHRSLLGYNIMFNELEVKWHSNRWLIRSFPYHATPNNSIVSTTPVICHVTRGVWVRYCDYYIIWMRNILGKL